MLIECPPTNVVIDRSGGSFVLCYVHVWESHVCNLKSHDVGGYIHIYVMSNIALFNRTLT